MKTLFFEKMEDETKEALKKKYECVFAQFEEVFQGYCSVHEKANEIKFKLIWDEYNITINANSKLISEDDYQITVNLFNVAYLEKVMDEHCLSVEIKQQMVSAIMMFTLWHEMSHVLYGHCTISSEYFNIISSEKMRQLETMCDLNATYCFLANMYFCLSESSHEVIIERYAMLFATMFIYFKELEESQNIGEYKYVPDKKVTLDERKHLFSTLRFDLVCIGMENTIKQKHSLTDFEVDLIYQKSIFWLDLFEYKEPLSIKPYYRRNNKHMIKAIPTDFEWMKQYIKKNYI